MGLKAIQDAVRNIWRAPLQHAMRRTFRGGDVRIISSNCIGGFLYHDLGRQFLSPTINLSMGNFISFCENLDEMMSTVPEELIDPAVPFPQAMLNGVLIRCVHYKSFSAFREKWEARAKRFREHGQAPIAIIASDAQIGPEEIDRFLALPYAKVCFTRRKELPKAHKEFVYVDGFDECETVGDLTRFSGILGLRKFERALDCVEWLNACCKK